MADEQDPKPQGPKPQDPKPDPDQKLKVTLVISGAVALGSYESGVIYELTRAARARGGPLTIDFVAGTSAGSITGAQVAKAMVSPVPDFSTFRLWADVNLSQLTRGYGPDETSPLSQSWIRGQLQEQLAKPTPSGTTIANDTGATYEWDAPPAQVRLLVTLTDLEGNVRTATYGDGINVPVEGCWNGVTVTTRLTPQSTPADWQRIAELVLGSSAHSAAWEAVKITVPDNNEGAERWEPDTMHRSLLARQQTKGAPWFVDGGTVTNLPVGQALRMMHRAGDKWEARPQKPFDPYRMMLYIEPDPSEVRLPSGEYSRWGQTALQAFRILTSPPISQGDLRWVGETNKAVADILRSVGEYCARTFGRPGPSGGDGGKVVPFPFTPPQELMDEAAAAAMPDEWGRLYRYLTAPVGDRPERRGTRDAQAEKSVDEFYSWLHQVGGLPGDSSSPYDATASFEPDDALDRLLAHLDQSPLGQRPRDGGDLGAMTGSAAGVLDRIRGAVLEVASWYYRLLAHPAAAPMLQAMVQFHKLQARHSPSGDRAWVYITRIVPGDEKPLARSLAHFGGFLHQPWMEHDYIVGRRCAIRWLREKFPHNEYVQSQLAILPDLPKVKPQTVEPRVVAQNAGAFGAILTRLRATALEEAPWLTSKPVVWTSRAFSALITSMVVWVLGLAAQQVGWIGDQAEAVRTLLNDRSFDPSLASAGASGVAGILATWIRTNTSLARKIQLLVLLWSVIDGLGRIWETTKAVFRPGSSAKQPPAQP